MKSLQYIYAISFLFSLLGLIGWFYSREEGSQSRKMSWLFLLGFLVYLFSLAFSPGSLHVKLFALFRDLMIMAVVSSIFSQLKKNKIIFWGGLILMLWLFQQFFFTRLKTTFVSENTDYTSEALLKYPLNEHAELLVMVSQDIQAIEPFLSKYELKSSGGFEMDSPQDTELDNIFKIDVPNEKIGDLEAVPHVEDRDVAHLLAVQKLRAVPSEGE